MAALMDEAAALKTEKKVLAFCRENRLLAPGDRVIAACSGGADSMALLLFLLRVRGRLGLTVTAAHVNHGIRGAAADADAAFVTAFCQACGVELALYDARRAGVEIPAAPSEDWARRLRYGWFEALAAEQGAKLATAHTLTDQAETLLFRLARGAGIHGASGIPVRRGCYIRPFLCLSRAETMAYCAALGQSYVQDETNAQDAYARNRLRHDALPALRQANPGAEAALGRFCTRMAEMDAYFAQKAEELLAAATEDTAGGWSLAALRAADAPVLDAALCRLIGVERDPDSKAVALLRGLVERGSGAVQLTSAVRYAARSGVLCREALPSAAALPVQKMLPQPFAAPGRYRLAGQTITAALVKYEEFLKNAAIYKKGSNCCADYDKIQKNAELRTRAAGDTFSQAGRGGRKTLKKFLNERAVPAERRGQLPLLAAGSEVLWLQGFGFAEGLAPGAGTRTVLILHSEKAEN